jgi:oxygen-dependent protoporphyrinogen oxidase
VHEQAAVDAHHEAALGGVVAPGDLQVDQRVRVVNVNPGRIPDKIAQQPVRHGVEPGTVHQVERRDERGALPHEQLGERASAAGTVRTSCAAKRISRTPDAKERFAVELDAGTTSHFDHVLLATPTRVAANVAAPLGEVAGALEGLMGYASSIAVFVAFPRAAVLHPLDATGFIAPRTERNQDASLLAATFVTSKWAGRAPEGVALFRVFLGGPNVPSLLAKDDRELVRIARAELAQYVPVAGEPSFSRVYRHERASPQPTVGHIVRRAKLAAAVAAVDGLHVAASGIDGVGIPDCVRQARAIAQAIAADPS